MNHQNNNNRNPSYRPPNGTNGSGRPAGNYARSGRQNPHGPARTPQNRYTRRNERRPGIRGYSNPEQKSSSGKVVLSLFGLIAAAAIIIILLLPKSENIPTLPTPDTAAVDAAQNAVVTEPDTSAVTADPDTHQSASQYAARNDSTVTLTNEIECQYGILIDLENNTVLADKSGDERIFPASMTKVMTILVSAENCENLEDTFTMTNEIVSPLAAQNAAVAGFAPGEKITVLDLLYGAALPSGADATKALAEYTAGSEEEFAKLMNAKCDELKLTGTHFVNSSGLHDDNHYSTCHDIALIMKAAMANETAKKVLSTYQYTTSKTTEHPDGITLTSTIFSRVEGSEEFDEKIEIVGGKTGYTGEAGQCLVTCAKVAETGKEYIFATAKGETKWKPVYDTIYVYRHFLGVAYDGEYVPKYMR